jgi:hypothetical protein
MIRRLLLCALLTGCGGGVIQRVDALPPPPPGAGFIELKVSPPDLELYLDDAYFGRADRWRGGVARVPAGPHRVALRRAGYYPWYGEIVAGEQAVTLAVALLAEPN